MRKNNKICILIAFFTLFSMIFAFFYPISYSKPVFAQSDKTLAKGMIVLEKNSNRILYCHNQDERLPMASTTKIITAIYVIEHNDNLDKVVEIPKEAVGIEGTSIGLKEGEHLTIKELLYGLMLRSGNDSAVALAIATSGSEKQFVDDVNAYLAERGYSNTHLMNPHGLHNDNHYTSASDLAKITAYALNNAIFAEIVSTKEIQISNELNSKTSRSLKNKNKLLYNCEYVNGVKTGYTRKAGRCFVGSATKNGMSLVCVLLNCVPMFEECEQLLSKGFEEYKLYKLISKEDKLGEIKVKEAKEEVIDVYAREDFYYPLKQSELQEVKMQVLIPSELTAPVEENGSVGKVEISLANQLIFSEKIYSIKYVKNNSFQTEFKKIIENM